jgi:hypothetical protein
MKPRCHRERFAVDWSGITENIIYTVEIGMDGVNPALVRSKTYFGRDPRERNLWQAGVYVAEASRRGTASVFFQRVMPTNGRASVEKWRRTRAPSQVVEHNMHDISPCMLCRL